MSSHVQLFSKDCSSVEAAAREARHLQTLRGPGIVPLQEAGAHGLALEKAACSLTDVLQERGPLAEREVRAVGAAAAMALARVHDAGLVHGDVKPANLLLSHDRELWLADFDAACPADGRPLERFSPGMLPPGAPARFAADMAALALTLVELSTGIRPDPGASWRAADLRRLGCSPALSAELSFMLGGDGAALRAGRAARMLARGGSDSLPAPAANAQRADSTPTVEFMAARPLPDSSPRPAQATGAPPPRWWQRLAASWRPGDATPRTGGRPQAQESGSSQASRSS